MTQNHHGKVEDRCGTSSIPETYCRDMPNRAKCTKYTKNVREKNLQPKQPLVQPLTARLLNELITRDFQEKSLLLTDRLAESAASPAEVVVSEALAGRGGIGLAGGRSVALIGRGAVA